MKLITFSLPTAQQRREGTTCQRGLEGETPTGASKFAAGNFLQQQSRFDDFVDTYNNQRPHQALNMRYPSECNRPSSRPYQALGELDYPFHDRTLTVTRYGRLCFNRRKINLSNVFAGQRVGVKQTDDNIWLVSFMHYDPGYFDQ